MKAPRDSYAIALLFFNLGARCVCLCVCVCVCVCVCAQRHAQSIVPPGMRWCPLCRRLREHQGWFDQARKISSPPAFDPRTVQPVMSRYTDYSIPAHKKKNKKKMFSLFCANGYSRNEGNFEKSKHECLWRCLYCHSFYDYGA